MLKADDIGHLSSDHLKKVKFTHSKECVQLYL